MIAATASDLSFACGREQASRRDLFPTRPEKAVAIPALLLLAALCVCCAGPGLPFLFKLPAVFLAFSAAWAAAREECFSADAGTLRIEYRILGFAAAPAVVLDKRDIQEVILKDKGSSPVIAFYCAGGKVVETRLSPFRSTAGILLRALRREVRQY